ncbi:cytochrome oxidase small assembly protein [Niveibacterium umoris]|uniref:Uncharacterized protein n=1 Tax=Niveibacterium umoris TaxID=1193620 RepID=A0A840BK86_9RHOO|nr:cytochrome oxidase small assembly protein [Niveibacterium umoris]MBB4013033.1 hypothetical protein [Niveibacterium umoris]
MDRKSALRNNRRTALTLGAVAVAFFVAALLKQWLVLHG